ncbi:myb-binding protein 1A [Anabrus simplex]|uniref:myb-binding protein 1A n=1 Tax=Anabrus simplex TaxID=316456 RepID=UPI0035A3AEF3
MTNMEPGEDVEHMAMKHLPNKHNEMESSVVDAFSKLRSGSEKERIASSLVILKHLYRKQEIENGELCGELRHALNKLVRGVGSSRPSSRTGYFSVLVGLLSFSTISVQTVLASVKKELNAGGNISKGEEAEVYTGRILACGAIIHSEILFRASPEEQQEVLAIMIAAGKKRSYLHLAVLTFLVELMKKLDEHSFSTILWPVLEQELALPWPKQNLETLHCLLLSRSRFPQVVRRKYLKGFLGSKHILHENCIEPCSQLLLNPSMLTSLRHPVYEEFCSQLAVSKILLPFWTMGVEPQLIRPNRNRTLAVLEMLQHILKNLDDKTKIPELLTRNFLDNILRGCNIKEPGNDVPAKARQVFGQIGILLQGEDVDDATRLSVLKRLLFYPGDFLFEKITGTKLVQLLMSQLKGEAIRELAEIYREVLSAEKPKVKGANGETGFWTGQERLYAAQLFTRLLARPSVMEDLEWKERQMKFLVEIGLFVSPRNEAGEFIYRSGLSAGAKECFFRALDQRLPRLDLLKSLMSSLVHHIDTLVFSSEESTKPLRHPLSETSKEAWRKMMKAVRQLEGKLESDPTLIKTSALPVFHILFLHMGLQLFQDATLAEESLQELHSCYKRIESGKIKPKKSAAGEEEPHWVEVAVDLFFSLLSRNSHLLRSLVGCVFPHMCPHITPTAIHQILQVLDPNSEKNPLSRKDSDDEDEESEKDSDSESDKEGKGDSENEAEESDESEMSDIDDQVNGNDVNLQLKMAVRKALGEAAETDVESVDMDEINEEEGKRMDAALSQAFKMMRMARPDKKKQSKDDRALTHFRVRVIDLLEVYLGTEPSLALCIDMIMPLFALLEFCIRDEHQKPLENRVRACIKKLSAVKRFCSTSGVDQRLLADVLTCLMDKGERPSVVYQEMSVQMSLCCTFLARCSQHLSQPKESTTPVEDVYKDALVIFFKKRDSLLPLSLFKSVLQISWNGSWSLASQLVEFTFDPEVRPFRRIQAVDLLQTFFHDRRLLSEPANKEKLVALEKALSQHAVKLISGLASVGDATRAGVKAKFVQNFLQLLYAVWQFHRQVKVSGMDWTALQKALNQFRESPEPLSLCQVKSVFNKLAACLGIGLIVGKKKFLNEQQTKSQKSSDGGDESDKEERGNSSSEDESSGKEVKENGAVSPSDEDDEDAEKRKKEKKEKRKREKKRFKEVAELKKKSLQMRIDAVSEGLDSGISFARVGLAGMNDENDTDMDSDKEDKKKKKKKQKKKEKQVLTNGGGEDNMNVDSEVETYTVENKNKRKLNSTEREHSKSPKSKKKK